MSDFTFLKNAISKKWVISAPRRAKRPDFADATSDKPDLPSATSDKPDVANAMPIGRQGTEPPCPFCPGNETKEPELYRIGGVVGDPHWEIRIILNKFPFAPHHELVINTKDHHTSFADFPVEHVARLFEVYRHRYNEFAHQGQVYIFHNHGEKAGESIPHSHTQITVIPDKVMLEMPRLEAGLVGAKSLTPLETSHFQIFCPPTSVWSDEVWIAPKKAGRTFGEVTDDELADFADAFSRLIKIFDLRYNKDFPFNFYIHPDGDWYFRMIPRMRTLGGFEVGTNVFVNTQNPQETLEFIKEHFMTPDIEKIAKEHQAEYHRTV